MPTRKRFSFMEGRGASIRLAYFSSRWSQWTFLSYRRKKVDLHPSLDIWWSFYHVKNQIEDEIFILLRAILHVAKPDLILSMDSQRLKAVEAHVVNIKTPGWISKCFPVKLVQHVNVQFDHCVYTFFVCILVNFRCYNKSFLFIVEEHKLEGFSASKNSVSP